MPTALQTATAKHKRLLSLLLDYYFVLKDRLGLMRTFIRSKDFPDPRVPVVYVVRFVLSAYMPRCLLADLLPVVVLVTCNRRSEK